MMMHGLANPTNENGSEIKEGKNYYKRNRIRGDKFFQIIWL
jgi:hypothetical protein